MQTFITNSTDSLGVENLDNKRLNKQLLEARQILNILVTMRNDSTATPAWRNHPAVKMWRGHEWQLFRYCIRVVIAMQERGISYSKNYDAIDQLIKQVPDITADDIPKWMADPIQFDKIITTHRSSLYYKDPVYYAQFEGEAEFLDNNRDWMLCCDRCNYYWPTHAED